MSPSLAPLIRQSRIIVCCGAGGVGKTTTAASVGLAAARTGRRVLVLTIDPSKRLAEALGVAQDHPLPQPPPAQSLLEAGIHTPACLDVWMLDPRHISQQAVRRLTRTPEEAALLMENRIFQNLSSMLAGMQEYTAMEALHGFVTRGQYDLVVLDTPPSRNALDFLESPGRLLHFFDGRIFQFFLPRKESALRNAAGKLIGRAFSSVFGEGFYSELQEFLSVFTSIFTSLTHNADEMRKELARADSTFLLVTSPAQEALTEALFFQEKTRQLGLPFRGFILNRSHAREVELSYPQEEHLGPSPSPSALSGLKKLQQLARSEQEAALRDKALLQQLAARAGGSAFAMALPSLRGGVDDIPTLVRISDELMKG